MITFSELGQWGRLGNQMYEYAALLGIGRELGYDVAIPPFEQHALGACFEITAPILRRVDRWRIRRVFSEPCIGYSPRYKSMRDFTDLRGYFQSPRYFPPREIVQREFRFRPEFAEGGEALLQPFRDEGRVLVGVNVRRGDYQVHPEQFVQIWASDFYDRAFERLAPHQPLYLISSDEPDWCRERFTGGAARAAGPHGSEIVVIDGVDDRAQLAALVRCDHLVVANSSFSWWAAWLNDGPGERIAPDRWWGEDCGAPDRDRDPLPAGWVELPVSF